MIMTADILTHRARVSAAAPAMWSALHCGDALLGNDVALDRRRAG
jgi:hypothetical protein